MPSGAVAAVDLGRSDGRVVVGHVGPTELRIDEVHRFRNEPVALPDGLHWDVVHLYREAIEGLSLAARRGDAPVSIGVTGWAADVCLLDADGALAGVPVHPTAERLASGPDGHATPPGRDAHAWARASRRDATCRRSTRGSPSPARSTTS